MDAVFSIHGELLVAVLATFRTDKERPKESASRRRSSLLALRVGVKVSEAAH